MFSGAKRRQSCLHVFLLVYLPVLKLLGQPRGPVANRSCFTKIISKFYLVGIWIPDIWITETFELHYFTSPVFRSFGIQILTFNCNSVCHTEILSVWWIGSHVLTCALCTLVTIQNSHINSLFFLFSFFITKSMKFRRFPAFLFNFDQGLGAQYSNAVGNIQQKLWKQILVNLSNVFQRLCTVRNPSVKF